VLGDESGYLATEHQKMKLAAMENMWETEPAPASFTIFAIPTGVHGEQFAIRVPWVLGLISTRTLSTVVPGINELVQHAEVRIRNGIQAAKALDALRANPSDTAARQAFDASQQDFGYALLLKKYRPDVENATDDEVKLAAQDTVPSVWTLFWSFRIMVGTGFFLIAYFAYWFWQASFRRLDRRRWALKLAVIVIPLPWIAIELGWLIAEFGRQPWVVEGVLPTFYAASGLHFWDLAISLAFFVILYTTLAVIMFWLMWRTIKHGPSDKIDLSAGEADVTSASAVRA
jgi:cytochrome d ubiquinol oxidase subunit I